MKIQTEMMLLSAVLLGLVSATPTQAQGKITFDHPWFQNGTAYYSLYYDTNGVSFRVDPYPPQPHDNMVRVGGGLAGHPNNGTPHLEFVNTLGIPQSVIFAWTNAASFGRPFLNGAPFGLVSVDLADPVAPSLAPIDITFNGFKGDGSMVSQTFTVGGGGSSSFQTFTFGSAFAHGLVRVEIPSPRWAMDNLVWVPEPSAYALLGLGLLAPCGAWI